MRVRWIDVAKGIGIVLVTLGHANARHLLGDYVGWWINAFHMPLFFVLAGLCFDAERYPKFGQYLVRKLRALGWPYFALATFMAVLSMGLYLGTDPQWSLIGQLQPFLSLETRVNTFWFIKTLFEVEILFWLLVKAFRNRTLIMCASLLFAAIGAFVIPEGGQILKVNTLLVSVFYYALGYVIKDAIGSLADRRSPVLWWCGLGVILGYSLLVGFFFHYTVGYWGCLLGNKALFFPLSLLAIFGVSVLSMAVSRCKYASRIFVWLGVNSIVLMATHGHCGVFRASWGANGFAGFPSVMAEYALFAVLCLTLAYPLNFLVHCPFPRRR